MADEGRVSSLPDTSTLPAAQELVMEVLAARYRLGERVWTFDNKQARTLKALEVKGYLSYKHGSVQGTRLAWMTTEGRAAAMDSNYTPPRDLPCIYAGCTLRHNHAGECNSLLLSKDRVPVHPSFYKVENVEDQP